MIDPTISAHYVGDCRKLLRQLPDACVQTCITSPPFYGLRDYGKRGQIGLEPTPEKYVKVLVKVFEEVWRVLKPDGTLWLNLGDSYSHGGNGSRDPERWPKQSRNKGSTVPQRGMAVHAKKNTGLKPKDLIGIPWKVAFALRDAGWYLRMDNIWSKPNPMPESVADRTTKSHEYLFHLAKSASYYYDGDAIAEPADNAGRDIRLGDKPFSKGQAHGIGREPVGNGAHDSYKVADMRNKRSVWEVPGDVTLEFAEEQARAWTALAATFRAGGIKPSVWNVTPVPYHGAHFATFPPALIEPCVLACSRPGDLVLDPFFGSGTTGEVAERYERRWIGFDISEAYAVLARERTAQRSLPLARAGTP
jgi:DNA modification methylase